MWEVIAKDLKSPLHRNLIWTDAFPMYKKLFSFPNVKLGTVSTKDNVSYICIKKTWTKCHEAIKKKVIENNDFLSEFIDNTENLGKEFVQWSEKNIFNKNMSKLTTDEIISLIDEFRLKQSEMYANGVVVVLLDFQGFSFIEDNLNKFLENKNLSEEEYKDAFFVFTQPENKSFSQEQEESLLKLMVKYKNNLAGIKKLSLSLAKEKFSSFYQDLQKHTKKYAWVYYVYKGPAYKEKDFFNFIKEIDYDAQTKLNEINQRNKDFVKRKKNLISKFKPNDFELNIINLASKIVWAKPRRKDYQSKAYYHFEKLQREVASRLKLSLQQVRSCPFEWIEKGLKGEKLDVHKINSIHDFHVYTPDGLLFGKDAKKFEYKEEVENFDQVDNIEGTPACPGKVTGRVKIINTTEEISKMEKGDILVSIATTPSIVPAMKKASAILTDEGGLTCHASIVSREFNIPCIVGLNFITQAVKDNDMVEVDADKGMVKIVLN